MSIDLGRRLGPRALSGGHWRHARRVAFRPLSLHRLMQIPFSPAAHPAIGRLETVPAGASVRKKWPATPVTFRG